MLVQFTAANAGITPLFSSSLPPPPPLSPLSPFPLDTDVHSVKYIIVTVLVHNPSMNHQYIHRNNIMSNIGIFSLVELYSTYCHTYSDHACIQHHGYIEHPDYSTH